MSIKLSDDLKYWRAERPSEWMMDEFIRKAEKMEDVLSLIRDEAKSFEERTGNKVTWLEDANNVLGDKCKNP